MHLTGENVEADTPQGVHAGVPLRNSAHAQQWLSVLLRGAGHQKL
jgi:hypothetical protein